jgi:serine phosphatase RsbU (regulator of sigma subunit)/Tfp pilus assembly protein PilF
MKPRTIIAVLLLALLAASAVHAQDQRKTDSLQRVVAGNAADSLKSQAYTELSLLFRQAGDPDSALSFARRGYDVAHRSGFAKGEGKALYYIGVVHALQGNYDAAEENYRNASRIFDSIGDRKNYSSVLTAIGGLYQYRGDPTTALEYHIQSLKIKKEIGDSLTAASVMMNIGTTYSTIGKPAEALVYFTEAYGVHLRAGDLVKVTDDCCNIGNMYHQLHQDSLGKVYLNRSIALGDSLGLAEILSYAYGTLAGVYYDSHQYDSAEYYYNKALVIAQSLDDKRVMSYEYMNLATVYDATGKTEKAEAYLKEALKYAKEVRALEAIRDIYSVTEKFYRAHGRFEDALGAYENYITYRDSILDVEKSAEFARQEMTLKYNNERALEKAEQDKKDAVTATEIRQQYLLIAAGAVVLLFVIVLAFVLYNRAKVTRRQNVLIQQQRDETEQQKQVIEEKNKSITDSITYARRIQQAILPQTDLIQSVLPESFVFYQPKDIVSGDFFWMSETPEHVFYATADCTGHGVPGGFMSILGASLLNEIVNDHNVTEPAEVLNQMRDKVIAALRQTGESGENKDGMDMVLCRIDKRSSVLTFAAANNPLWLCREGRISEYAPDKQPVGIGATPSVAFTQQTVQLGTGDVIYTFTDGFADQFGGEKGKKFKYKPLRNLLESNAGAAMNEQHTRLAEAFSGWKGELEQVDDVLVIGVRI